MRKEKGKVNGIPKAFGMKRGGSKMIKAVYIAYERGGSFSQTLLPKRPMRYSNTLVQTKYTDQCHLQFDVGRDRRYFRACSRLH